MTLAELRNHSIKNHFPVPKEEREYYCTLHGFDPASDFTELENGVVRYEAWFPLHNDPSFDIAKMRIGARVDYNKGESHNRIIFRRGNAEASVFCTHTVVHVGPAEDALTFADDSLLRRGRTPEEAQRIAVMGQPIDLPPWGHFAALKSYVAGIAEVGLLNLLFPSNLEKDGYLDDAFTRPFGFNVDMQEQILEVLFEIAPDLLPKNNSDHFLELVEKVPEEWLATRWHLLVKRYEIYGLNSIIFRNPRYFLDLPDFLQKKIIRVIKRSGQLDVDNEHHSSYLERRLPDLEMGEGIVFPEITNPMNNIGFDHFQCNKEYFFPHDPIHTGPSVKILVEYDEYDWEEPTWSLTFSELDGTIIGTTVKTSIWREVTGWNSISILNKLNSEMIFNALKAYARCFRHIPLRVLRNLMRNLQAQKFKAWPKFFTLFEETRSNYGGIIPDTWGEHNSHVWNWSTFNDPIYFELYSIDPEIARTFAKNLLLKLIRIFPAQWLESYWYCFDTLYRFRELFFTRVALYRRLHQLFEIPIFREISWRCGVTTQSVREFIECQEGR